MMYFTAPAGQLLAPSEFFARLQSGHRLVTFYGRPDAEAVVLTAAFAHQAHLEAFRTRVLRADGFPSLTRTVPAFHVFEREVYEQCGLEPRGHPWLKPIRMPSYPFYRLDGHPVHEVGVGPIHAGVIEPAHFRFMCLGETIHHLEIQLGFQHRGVEALLLQRDPWTLAPLVETIAGDSSVAHAWTYSAAMEALAGVAITEQDGLSRGIALELERVANHLSSVAGICNDVAFLQGASTYGRLRTTAINTSMLLCGSRFGRRWVAPGCARASMRASAPIRANLALLREDLGIINRHLWGSRSVWHRLQEVGTVSRAQAEELGLVGLAARASGVELDARAGAAPYVSLPIATITDVAGDCWARTMVRLGEMDASLAWLEAAVDLAGEFGPTQPARRALAPDTLAIALCEGWRGEVVHALETGPSGELLHYKVQDPSLRNWFALALAVRNDDISDFPICNKSFDLSYCGNDL
jgi:Ni,Fe-hydrogenase III large subunit